MPPGNCVGVSWTAGGAAALKPEGDGREAVGVVVGVHLDALEAAAELQGVVAGDVGRGVDELVGAGVAALRLEGGDRVGQCRRVGWRSAC